MFIAPYGMFLALVLLGVFISGSKHVFDMSPKKKSDAILFGCHIFSDIFIAGSIFALFYLVK